MSILPKAFLGLTIAGIVTAYGRPFVPPPVLEQPPDALVALIHQRTAWRADDDETRLRYAAYTDGLTFATINASGAALQYTRSLPGHLRIVS